MLNVWLCKMHLMKSSWVYCSIEVNWPNSFFVKIFKPDLLTQAGVVNKDPTVWLDGAWLANTFISRIIGLLVFRFVANEYKRIAIRSLSTIRNIQSGIRRTNPKVKKNYLLLLNLSHLHWECSLHSCTVHPEPKIHLQAQKLTFLVKLLFLLKKQANSLTNSLLATEKFVKCKIH